MGGYAAPRCATAEKRIKAVAVWSGAFSLVDDIFDCYPPIQERMRWLIGAQDLAHARRVIGEFTLEGRAKQIECPMLIGYSHDDPCAGRLVRKAARGCIGTRRPARHDAAD
jgi:hypothetical protein